MQKDWGMVSGSRFSTGWIMMRWVEMRFNPHYTAGLRSGLRRARERQWGRIIEKMPGQGYNTFDCSVKEKDYMTGLGSGSWFQGIVNVIILVVVIAAIGGGTIALVVWLVRQLIQRDDNPKKTAFDIVKERYAKGEINKEQFEQIKKDLA